MSVRDDRQREVREEFEFHLEMRVRQLLAEGLSPEEARRRAREMFGDPRAVARTCRDLAELRDQRQERKARWASWGDDVRDSLRSIRRRPAATVAVFVMLTSGLAVTTAALALALGILRAGLPYPDPAALVALQGRLTQEGRTQNWPAGYLDMVDLQEQVAPHVQLAAHSAARPLNLLTPDGADVVHAEMVSASYFDVLRVAASQGRVFSAAEDARGAAAAVVVLSDGFWRQRFGGSNRIGSPLVLNERSYTIIGVMPAGFRGITDRADLWLPVNAGAAIYTPAYISARPLRWLSIIGRRAEGVSLSQSADLLRRGSAEIAEREPGSNGGLVFEPLPLEARVFGTLPLSVYAAAAGAALVMLLVFVNVGGLSLARAVTTQRDLAVRRALGASNGRLIRQASIQWLLVGGAAAVCALAIAPAVLQGVVASGAFRLPSFVDISFTWRLTLLLPLLAGIGAAVAVAAPAALVRHTSPGVVGAGSRTSAPLAIRRIGRVVVFTQVAVAAALMFTGLLMIRSVAELRDGALGWDPTDVGALRIDLLGERYATPAAKWQFAEALLGRLDRRASAPIALSGPGGVPTGELFLTRPVIEDFRPAAGEQTPWLSWHMVTPQYFDVLGIELLRGRGFTDADRDGAQRVAIVTASLARRFWPGVDPIGRRIKFGARDNTSIPWTTIVGIVSDVDYEAHARERDLAVQEHLFVPFAQHAPTQPARAHLLVKTDRLTAVAADARDALREIAPTLPLHAPVILRDALERQTVRDRLIAAILALFGGAALVVSALGIYCTVAFEVARRAPEYGIRLALGAARRHIVRLATGETAMIVLGGVAAGVTAGVTLATFGRALLFGVEPVDGVTTALVCLLLPIAAAVGLCRPLWKAVWTDPARVLRQD